MYIRWLHNAAADGMFVDSQYVRFLSPWKWHLSDRVCPIYIYLAYTHINTTEKTEIASFLSLCHNRLEIRRHYTAAAAAPSFQ